MSNGTNPYAARAGDVDVFGTNKYKSLATGYQPFNVPITASAGPIPLPAGASSGGAGVGAAVAAAGGGGGGGVSSGKAGAFGQIAGGLAGIAGGIVGGRKRRREQRQAEAELRQRKSEYEAFEFKDPTANMTNPFEDLTVNQQQARFESQQQQQALAGTLSGLTGAAGGSGIASLAQTLAQQSSTNLQASAASIGMQESRNQMARAQGQQALEAQRAQGAQYVQEREFGRVETQLDAAAQRKAAADAARQKATEGLIGGIANVAVGGARLAAGGM